MHPLVKAFIAVWFTGLTLLCGVPLILLSLGIGHGSRVLAIVAWSVMSVFGALVVIVGRKLGKGGENEILTFLTRTLEASVVDVQE